MERPCRGSSHLEETTQSLYRSYGRSTELTAPSLLSISTLTWTHGSQRSSEDLQARSPASTMEHTSIMLHKKAYLLMTLTSMLVSEPPSVGQATMKTTDTVDLKLLKRGKLTQLEWMVLSRRSRIVLELPSQFICHWTLTLLILRVSKAKSPSNNNS